MIPKPLHVLNEGLAFVLELLALFAFGWWGFHAGHGLGIHLLLGLGAPALMILVWGTYAAPRARVKLPIAGVVGVKAVVFAGATAAMYATGWHTWAVVFGVVAVLNTGLATADREALINQRTTAEGRN